LFQRLTNTNLHFYKATTNHIHAVLKMQKRVINMSSQHNCSFISLFGKSFAFNVQQFKQKVYFLFTLKWLN